METFTVPHRLNRNAADVQRLGRPADTGRSLLDYLAQRLGRADLSGLDVLDFGCGSRFAEAIIVHDVPLASYVGVDVWKEMVEWLSEHASAADERLAFFHLNAKNNFYNPQGTLVGSDTTLPFENRLFDVICLFSVITHQNPTESQGTFTLLRQYLKADGRLFFTAFVEGDVETFQEKQPDLPGAQPVYSFDTMQSLLDKTRWTVLSFRPRNDQNLPLLASFLCAPT
jgi:SAM-dependent methyltransferase